MPHDGPSNSHDATMTLTLEALRVGATRRAKAPMLDPQERTMTDRRIGIYDEHDNVLLDTTDPATYTFLDDPRDLLTALPDPDLAN